MIFEKGLRIYCVFREKVGLESARRMSGILIKAHMYINYEEKILAKDVERNKGSGNPLIGRLEIINAMLKGKTCILGTTIQGLFLHFIQHLEGKYPTREVNTEFIASITRGYNFITYIIRGFSCPKT